jgi:hypothetical protein
MAPAGRSRLLEIDCCTPTVGKNPDLACHTAASAARKSAAEERTSGFASNTRATTSGKGAAIAGRDQARSAASPMAMKVKTSTQRRKGAKEREEQQ